MTNRFPEDSLKANVDNLVFLFGAESIEVMEALDSLAGYYAEEGRFLDAAEACGRSLLIRTKLYGLEHPDVGKALAFLGFCNEGQDKLSDAENNYKQALEVLRRFHGDVHPDVADVLQEMAILKSKQGNYGQAKDLLEEAYLINAQALAAVHPKTASNLANIAILYANEDNYGSARDYFYRALEILDQINHGEIYPDLIDLLSSLARLHQAHGFLFHAEAVLKRLLSVKQISLGDLHEDVAMTLNDLGNLYLDNRMYGEAEPMLERALSIREQILGEANRHTATSQNNLGLLFLRQKKYDAAKFHFDKAITIIEQTLGKQHPESAVIYNNLGLLFFEQGLFCEAENHYSQVLEILNMKAEYAHPQASACLANLARVYEEQGFLSKAEASYRKALEALESCGRPEPQRTASLFHDLASIHRKQYQYSESERYYNQALDTLNLALGENYHHRVADISSDLASLYMEKGLYQRCEPLYQRALQIRVILYGNNHLQTALTLSDLALMYRMQERFYDSEQLYIQAMAAMEKDPGHYDLHVAYTASRLADLYLERGLYGLCEPLYKRALAIREEALDRNDLLVLNSALHLARLYVYMGLYDQAEPLLWRLLRIEEGTPDSAFSIRDEAVNCLSGIYIHTGSHEKAEVLLERAMLMNEGWRGPRNMSLSANLNTIALLHVYQCHFEQAEALYMDSLSIAVDARGMNDPSAYTVTYNLAHLYVRWNRYEEAINLFDSSLRSSLSRLLRMAPCLARSRRVHLVSVDKQLHSFPSNWLTDFPAFSRLFLFARLNHHGLMLEIERRQSTLTSDSGEHLSIVRELAYLDSALSSSQVDAAKRISLSDQRDELEARLYSLSSGIHMNTLEVGDVASALPANSVLIEFQRLKSRLERAWDPYANASYGYLAFILFPSERIETIDLGLAEPIEAAINLARTDTVVDDPDASQAWLDLSELLIAPLMSHLQGVTHCYLSLDGELHRVPFHVLPLPGEPDRLLVETVTLQLLTSGRDLLDQHQPADAPRAVTDPMVVADPSFDHAPLSPEQSPQDSDDHQPRSRDMGALKAWAPLPNSAIEGQQIAELLGASLFTGSHATTVTVQQAKRPRVLHIATHGYFLPDQSEPQERQSWMPLDGHDLLARFRGEDPMLRSGLVFAGANHPVADPAEDDGYLTAQEAVHLNLQGTELVTLSACDAGSGDIRTGEGVYGLQRALIVAGARSMLLSLWPVPDAATCEFMVRFYTLLKQGAGRFDALVAVQREFRQHGNVRWRHPYYWGAWQLIGDGGPISGL
jgi:CHAT domain-containing protein/tetratricopeptide (TPR) repeat protein